MTLYRRKAVRAATTCVMVMAAAPIVFADAQTTTDIRMRQIIVAGDQNVEATWINNHDTIVATLYAGITEAASGIELQGDTVTTLPIPYAGGGPPHPKVIDDQGDVLGWADDLGPDPRMFLIKDGMTVEQYNIILAREEGGQNFIIQPIGLSDRKRVFGTIIVSYTAPNTAFYGLPGHLKTVPSFNRFQHINSMNKSGTVAGISFTFSGNPAVFAGTTGHFVSVSPPGAVSSQGGYVNDAGELAGSYADASRVQHGFTLSGSTYATFDMPEPASDIHVTGINNSGRIVGVYTSQANGRQHAFLYNGTAVTIFGVFDNVDTVSVALNDHGAMVVDRQLYSFEPHFQSFTASCTGPGC